MAEARELAALRRAPLAALHGALAEASDELVSLREVPFLRQLDVRADEPAARALGLPLEPNTLAADGDRTTLWLGPDQWLVIATPDGDDPAADLAAGGEPAGGLPAGGEPARGPAAAGASRGWVTMVDLSANRTAIEVSGPGARDLLAQGCSLDLHPRAFGPGRCAQTLLARAQVILEARGDDAFRVWVRCSFATYLATWLIDAAAGLRGAERVAQRERERAATAAG